MNDNFRANNSEEFDFDEFLVDPEFAAGVEDAETRFALVEKLRDVRKQSKISQKQLASEIGTTQSAISDFERGETDPQLSTIQRYARAVGASVKFVIDQPTSNVATLVSPYTSVQSTLNTAKSPVESPTLHAVPAYRDVKVS